MYLVGMCSQKPACQGYFPRLLAVSHVGLSRPLPHPGGSQAMMIQKKLNTAPEVTCVNLLCPSILSPIEIISNWEPLGRTRWKEEDGR